MNVLLTEILKARESRAERQQALLQEFHCPVVCFTMNIAGPVKTSPLIRRAFNTGLAALEDALGEYTIHSRETIHESTGDEAIFCVDAEDTLLKTICTVIEEGSPMGRLFDMDVIGTEGKNWNAVGSAVVWFAANRDEAALRDGFTVLHSFRKQRSS